MERLRAALVGCILAGGVLFGARPVVPDNRVAEPVVSSSGPGNRIGMTPEELARWVRLPAVGATLTLLRPGAAAPAQPHIAGRPPAFPRARQRCNSGRVRRYTRL
jgi:hypothetical protein